MSNKTEIECAVQAERERILKILRSAGLKLPGSAQVAIYRGQAAREFFLGQDGEAAAVPVVIAASAGTPAGGHANASRGWREVTGRLNARYRAERQALTGTPAAAAHAPTEAAP